MKEKKQYYGLDEIGFVGMQDKRSEASIKADLEMTTQYIKDKKIDKVISISQKRKSSKAR